MAALKTELVESCRSFSVKSTDLFRSVSPIRICSDRATADQRQCGAAVASAAVVTILRRLVTVL
jgi:hypothetical protein